MNRKSLEIVAVFTSLLMVLNIFGVVFIPAGTGTAEFPDYEAVDWQSGLAGKQTMPTIEESLFQTGSDQSVESLSSTPPVGTTVYDWYINAISGEPWITLRALSGNVEIWVQDNLLFPPGDPRNADPYNLAISDDMVQHLADEFNSVMYPTDTTFFGTPEDRDGTNTIFEIMGWPSFTYDWIATDNPQRVILKVLNYRDENYYDPTYPYYVAGFYSSTYTRDYYKRNMIHIDAWRWWQRLGPEGNQWFSERPDLEVTRPYLYESVTTHEYQHNIHRDWNPDDDAFMNEGCSMYAEVLCGYGVSWSHVNSYLATPDNSLIEWEDQGGINVLADYGAATLWTVYLADHYGGPDFIRHFVQAGIPGIEGINAALMHFGYTETFDDVYHNWRIANLIHTDLIADGTYNYETLDLGSSDADPIRTYTISGLPVPETMGTDFGNTITILGYDTGIADVGAYGSDYIILNNWDEMAIIFFDGDDTAVYGWTMTEEGWWSGMASLMNTIISGEAYVDPEDPTLEISTKYDIEELWDYGFVQVSTDGGANWVSLENAYTTYDYDPSAHPDIIANLPGLTSTSVGYPAWMTMTFDLSAYAGETVLIGFRYMTDWATLWDGWYINEAIVSGEPVTLTPVYPEADFQVSLVRVYVKHDVVKKYLVNDIELEDETETGTKGAHVNAPDYVILVVSYVGQKGLADYAFWVNTPPIRMRIKNFNP